MMRGYPQRAHVRGRMLNIEKCMVINVFAARVCGRVVGCNNSL